MIKHKKVCIATPGYSQKKKRRVHNNNFKFYFCNPRRDRYMLTSLLINREDLSIIFAKTVSLHTYKG